MALLLRSLCRCACHQTRVQGTPLLTSRIRPATLPTITSARTIVFWEKHQKAGYDTEIKMTLKEKVEYGMKQLKPEMAKFKDEMYDKFSCDSLWLTVQHGDYEILWQFNDQETIDEFIVTKDSDHNEGYSDAEFVLSRANTGLFQGYLNTKVPQDGVIVYSGYASIRSPRKMKSFKRKVPYDFCDYTHLLVRYRGDGRSYAVVMGLDREYDVHWNDQYSFALYTRGGPYWQIAKIPLSKFFLAAYGRIQDKQDAFMDILSHISNISITLGDGTLGPFQLEIDFLGLMCDDSHTERTSYEMYQNKAHQIY